MLSRLEAKLMLGGFDTGAEDFFRDLQADSRKKENTEAKPKSLWEELAVCTPDHLLILEYF